MVASRIQRVKTDASAKELGNCAWTDTRWWETPPIAYASQALTSAETNYVITELETLVVMWACIYVKAYLYGHSVIIYTDHWQSKPSSVPFG